MKLDLIKCGAQEIGHTLCVKDSKSSHYPTRLIVFCVFCVSNDTPWGGIRAAVASERCGLLFLFAVESSLITNRFIVCISRQHHCCTLPPPTLYFTHAHKDVVVAVVSSVCTLLRISHKGETSVHNPLNCNRNRLLFVVFLGCKFVNPLGNQFQIENVLKNES